MSLQDIEFVTKTQLGCKNAEAEFEDELTKLMPFLRLCTVIIRSREFAEDLAQELWRRHGVSSIIRSRIQSQGLLFTILRNEYFPTGPLLRQSLGIRIGEHHSRAGREQEWQLNFRYGLCDAWLNHAQREA